MSFIPAFQYFVGIGVFGFTGWLLGGVRSIIVDQGVHETGYVFTLLGYLWVGMFIIYILFGGYWVIRKYTEREYMGGM